MFVSVMVMGVVAAAPPARSVDGGLPLGWVSEVIDLSAVDVSWCLQPPSSKASVSLEFSIAPSGKVTHATPVGAGNTDPKRVACLTSVVERLEFPAADAGTEASWLFTSSAARDAGVPTQVLLGAADVPPEWVDDVGRCARADAGVADGRGETELLVSESGFVLRPRRVVFPPGEGEFALEQCVREATHRWRLPGSSRRIVLAQWALASTASEAKKLASNACVEIVTKGGLEKSDLRAVITAHTAALRSCYELQLQKHPDLAGKVTVGWQIDADGTVSSANVKEATLDDALVQGCILAVVRSMKFPRPIGGGKVNVTYPWNFTTVSPVDPDATEAVLPPPKR